MPEPIADADVDVQLTWRRLELRDIESLVTIADTIHPGLPERADVFAERVALFPEGCWALIDVKSDKLHGYAVSHPILFRKLPVLDTFLGQIHPNADQYFIHDVAILPRYQGKGYSKTCIEKILQIANDYATTCLISVYGTAPFWQKHSFGYIGRDEAMIAKLLHYGEDAVFLERRNQRGNE